MIMEIIKRLFVIFCGFFDCACHCHFRQFLKMLLSEINKGVVSLAVTTCQQIPMPPMGLGLKRSPHSLKLEEDIQLLKNIHFIRDFF